jgi:periplasmic divalent cation tolerance protein
MKIIFTTTNDRKIAKEMSLHLLKMKLAACIQIVSNIETYYIWNDNIENANEYKLIIKTKNENLEKLVIELKKIHNYEIPEIVSIDLTIMSQEYSKWFNYVQ